MLQIAAMAIAIAYSRRTLLASSSRGVVRDQAHGGREDSARPVVGRAVFGELDQVAEQEPIERRCRATRRA